MAEAEECELLLLIPRWALWPYGRHLFCEFAFNAGDCSLLR